MAPQLVQQGSKPQVQPPPIPQTGMRRFELADLSEHGGWILKRLQKVRPDCDERRIANWLRGHLYSNESLFLYQPNGCALAQVSREDTLTGEPIVHERFVLVKEGHEEAGAEFYSEFHRWAKALNAKTMIVEELSDVPHELIKARLGARIFERKQQFVRV